MGFPSMGVEKVYRNPITQVQKFLNEYHPYSHKVYNLCSERSYPANKFYAQESYPFDDHNCPTIDLLAACCKDLDQWLCDYDDNVAAIHCKAGKGRTGLVICAFLAYKYQDKMTAEDALQFYAQRRTHNEQGVTIPSQIRFVRYFGSVLTQIKSNTFNPDRPRKLRSITFTSPPQGVLHPTFTMESVAGSPKFFDWKVSYLPPYHQC
eukprot:TRINITY_DN6197_c0_g4_i9.p1 TRINITY_DN6197_c0_g4~~TRINITY_DN6197_c0_g4_i9.p1  ORF type:complete len:207 (-),score=44.58 TRINITY_DN6197_c0_g4_i9:194-814(-)